MQPVITSMSKRRWGGYLLRCKVLFKIFLTGPVLTEVLSLVKMRMIGLESRADAINAIHPAASPIIFFVFRANRGRSILFQNRTWSYVACSEAAAGICDFAVLYGWIFPPRKGGIDSVPSSVNEFFNSAASCPM
jgi:hypothetical protein